MISPQPTPIIGQSQAHARAAIQAAMQQMSVGIYQQLATAHINSRDEHQAVDVEHLRQVARDSGTAARCYFEGIGAIEQEGGSDGQA